MSEKQEKYDALAVQVGGDHYKGMKIQPVEFIHANNIGFLEGSAIKYLCRHKRKGGVEDLKKAKHFIDLLIELEEPKPSSVSYHNECGNIRFKAGAHNEVTPYCSLTGSHPSPWGGCPAGCTKYERLIGL